MTIERFGATQFRGVDQTVVGPDLKVGDTAPDFEAVATDWTAIRVLVATPGMVRVLAALPSLETSVCDRETRRFNEEASRLSEDVRIFAISTDLPYTQDRWCGAAGIDRVKTLSDHMATEFGVRYGCLIKEKRILRRAVFVVGRDDRIVYADYMKAMGDEPKYAEVLEVVRRAL
ncbi:MAG: thiol peroxidase [Chloroflexi bacterium RBG_13_68_17]|nr:MAG: thiol peroxidase [Chloroflexi bacterium RBG_13_68_17]